MTKIMQHRRMNQSTAGKNRGQQPAVPVLVAQHEGRCYTEAGVGKVARMTQNALERGGSHVQQSANN